MSQVKTIDFQFNNFFKNHKWRTMNNKCQTWATHLPETLLDELANFCSFLSCSSNTIPT